MRDLPIPDFFDPAAARWSYRPDAQALADRAAAWRRTHDIGPAAADRAKVRLLLIDQQKDFCFPEGTLHVRGAEADCARIARFIYTNLGTIGEITCTMDTHFPHQIFFASFWRGARGEPLAPHREISLDDVRRRAVRPNPALAAWLAPGGDAAWLERQVEFYCGELERAGKVRLYLWPPHCLLGSEGHALAGIVDEARLFHAYARGARDAIEAKGGNALTENYSALAPEVLVGHDGRPIAARNEALIDELLRADALVIAGEAASHCVRATVEDLLAAIRARDERLAERVYLLEDCMSAIVVPDPAAPGRFLADFRRDAEAALARFAEAGMHVVRSTETMARWPQIRW